MSGEKRDGGVGQIEIQKSFFASELKEAKEQLADMERGIAEVEKNLEEGDQYLKGAMEDRAFAQEVGFNCSSESIDEILRSIQLLKGTLAKMKTSKIKLEAIVSGLERTSATLAEKALNLPPQKKN